MKALTTGFGIAAALLAVALMPDASAAASSEAVVPPENSAASQYTEAIPTVGGNKPGGGNGGHRSPARVLGARNAHRLESHGKAGREVAGVVAATAPGPAAGSKTDANTAQGNGGGGSGRPAAGSRRHQEETRGSAGAESARRNAGGVPNGSSGLLEVIGQATGSSSSGDLGPLLPLAIAGGIVWAAAYLRRQRRRLG
jgi:hypothetical protein